MGSAAGAEFFRFAGWGDHRMGEIVAALVILLASTSAFATPTLVQHTNCHVTAEVSVACTLPNSVAEGDTLIVVAGSGAVATISSESDSLGNTVSAAVAFSSGSDLGMGIYYVQSASSGTHTITLTFGSSGNYTAFVSEYSGLATSGVFDKASPISYQTSVSITTAPITPSNSGELVIFGITQVLSGNTYSSYTNGFTQQDTYNANGPSGAWASVVTGSSVSGGVTAAAPNTSGAVIAAFVASPVGFLPAGHWAAAKLPMTVIFPRPDTETRAWAREHWAYWDGTHPVKYEIPIEAQGGAYPYVFTLLSGPPGMSIAQSYWIPGDTPAQMLALGYGDLIWTPQGNISSTWKGTVSVLITGQDGSSVTDTFTLSTVGAYARSSSTANATLNGTTTLVVNSVSAGLLTYGTVVTGAADLPNNDWIVGQVSGSAGGAGTYTLAYAATGSTTESITGSLKVGFVFADSTCGQPGNTCDTSGSGTISSPWSSLSKIYGPNSCIADPSGCSTYPGAIAYLRGLNPATNYEAVDQTGGGGSAPGFTLSGKNNPIALLGFPGDPNTPNIDITNLSATTSAKGAVFELYDDASDAFIQNLAFSGEADSGSGSGPAGFTYIWEEYANNRLTFDGLSNPNAWPGTCSTCSNNSSTVELDDPGTPTRSYVVIKGVNEANRPGKYYGVGIYDAFNTNYGVAEFDSFQGVGTGAGSAYGRKLSDTYWTNRYDFSSGASLWLLWQGGFVANSNQNTYFEDCYDTLVFTGSPPSNPGLIYNQAIEGTTNVFSYETPL